MLFRIFSAALLGGAVTYYVMNQDAFESLDDRLLAETKRLKQVELLIEEESNASEANMTDLLKINREYRKELELLEENSEGARDELSFLLPKIKSLKEQLSTAEQELRAEEEKINQVKLKTAAEKDKLPALANQKEDALAKLNEVSQFHASAEENWRRLDQNFSSLSRVRETARETYTNAKNPLMEEIIRPFEVFYGDSIEVQIDSVSRKEKGFFIKLGLEKGIRSGFVFLIQKDENWYEMPEFVICSLAEKNYSFLKMIQVKEGRNPSSFQVGEKLTLIRSAELTNAIDSSNFINEKTLSQTDL